MALPRRFAALAAAALAVAALLLCCAPIASAAASKQLYPSCGGDELQASAQAQATSTLFTFADRAKSVTITCLAYEVVSVKGSQRDTSKDYCAVAHQTDYAYSLAVQATYTTPSGNSMTRLFPIRDMTGGSLGELTVQMPELSRFSIVFTNQATNAGCNMKVRALMSFSTSSSADANGTAPAVVAVEPRTVFAKSFDRSYLVLYHAGEQRANRDDTVTLVDYTEGTCKRQEGEVLTMDFTTTLPDSVHTTGRERNRYGVRATTFHEPNTYRVCFRAAGSTDFTQIAVITVFAGNPAYYDVISGTTEKGQVVVGVETTIKFYGVDLDTRKSGDQAKFVDFDAECDSGAPAGGVPLADDLEPEDHYGPNTTYSLWTWTMTEGGSFKVCYKRKASATWTEVPYIEDAGVMDGPEETTLAPIPTPTNPNTKAECPVLQREPAKPWPKYKSAEVTLTVSKMPDTFLDTLMDLLCLPRDKFTLAHLQHDAKGKQLVYVLINCEDESDVSKRVCDSVERYNYFAGLNAATLKERGIAAVQGSVYMFAFGDDERSSGTSKFAVVVIGICILGAGGMIAFAVARYQERRHHFVQFGLDDEDIDDMYDFSAAPTSAMRNEYDVNVPPPPPHQQQRIHNAVIEIEE